MEKEEKVEEVVKVEEEAVFPNLLGNLLRLRWRQRRRNWLFIARWLIFVPQLKMMVRGYTQSITEPIIDQPIKLINQVKNQSRSTVQTTVNHSSMNSHVDNRYFNETSQ